MNDSNKAYVSINSISEEQRKQLRGVVEEISDSLTRIAAERDFQKEALKNISESTGVEKKIIRRMAKTYFKSNFNSEVEENNLFEEFFDGVMK